MLVTVHTIGLAYADWCLVLPFSLVGCPPGQYHTAVNDMWVCSECDIGYYQAKAGSTSCVQCPNRYTTVSHGSRLLDQCLGKMTNKHLK